MAKQTKRTKAHAGVVGAVHQIPEAVKLVKANATAKFDETVEIAVNLGIDPRHADQQVRGVVALPSRATGLAAISMSEEITFMPGWWASSNSSQ